MTRLWIGAVVAEVVKLNSKTHSLERDGLERRAAPQLNIQISLEKKMFREGAYLNPVKRFHAMATKTTVFARQDRNATLQTAMIGVSWRLQLVRNTIRTICKASRVEIAMTIPAYQLVQVRISVLLHPNYVRPTLLYTYIRLHRCWNK